ncbi:MAG: hypothetical protein ACI90V_014030, partial [Bacillariaceae sp.]
SNIVSVSFDSLTRDDVLKQQQGKNKDAQKISYSIE